VDRNEHFDAVIVGSGFGGSVTAFRLAEAGWRVCLLERGKAYGPGDFPRSPRLMARNFWDPSEGLHGLFDVWSFRHIEAVVSAGLGGGSLIYANVLIRKDERWFVHDSPFTGGYEHWPVSRADLDSHYDCVEEMLGAQRLPVDTPGYPDVPKTRAMREAASHLGLEWHLPHLAVTFANADRSPMPGEPIPEAPYGNVHGRPRQTCRLCGECDVGCNFGAKNTLDHTYLSAARHHGAELRTRCEVRSIAPRAEGGFVVGYVEHRGENEGRQTDTAGLPLVTLTADQLILGAGALGTPYLLLRNHSVFPHLGPALGTRFSGNGDVLGFALGGGQGARWDGADGELFPSTGPVITSAIRVPDAVDADGGAGPGSGATRRGFYVEDAGYPGFADWMVETTSLPATARRLLRFAWHRAAARFHRDPKSRLGAELASLVGEARLSGCSLPLLGMGRDVPDGRLSLRRTWLDVDWKSDTSEEYFEAVKTTMAELAEALGTRFHGNPMSRFKRLITVHPLGGCPMGRHVGEGVVDAWGEAFGHPGLFVVDGAAMPGPVGANPSLTIAAFADRAAQRMVERGPARPGKSVAVGALATAGAVAESEEEGRAETMSEQEITSLEFTEEMKGHVTLGESDFETGERNGKEAGTALMFHLTIHIDDVDRFIADRGHEATARGWVECEALGGRLPVEAGIFNLFVEGEDPTRTNMLYHLPFKDGAGHALTLSGFKVIRDDPGFDVWSDTTTLYTRVLAGHPNAEEEPSAETAASGILHIQKLDFAQQVTTFRARGPHPVEAIARFGRLFIGRLWGLYAPRAHGDTG
jgi:cholesterol oxidase